MEGQAFFLDIDYARARAHATAQPLVRLFNSAGTQVYSYLCFQFGLHYEAIERLRNSISYATIEAPRHDATGWGMSA